MPRNRAFSLILFIFFSAGRCLGSGIIANFPKIPAVVVENEPGVERSVGEAVCLYAENKKYVCGRVMQNGKRGFAVKLPSVPNKWMAMGTNLEVTPKKTPKVAVAVQPTPAPVAKADAGAVNLNEVSLDSLNSSSAAVPEQRKQDSPHHNRNGAKPKFRILFDFLLTNRPGIVPSLTFDTYHNILWLEYYPNNSITFSAEVASNPRFFEIGYRFSPKLELRLGKIWIPFDDLGPHTIYGGRANIAKMSQPNTSVFLPDVWSDLGAVLNLNLVRTRSWEIDGHLYVVNGFQEGGTDPTGVSTTYPEFSTLPLQDNNYDKAVGGRLHAFYKKFFGVGISGYRGRFSNQANESAGIYMFGADMQLHMTSTTEFRTGYAYMGVTMPAPETNFRRGGFYGELGQGIGRFKVLARAGQSQNDSRVVDITDQTIIGGAVVYRAGPVQLSVEHSRDLNVVPTKEYYNFTGARLVSMF